MSLRSRWIAVTPRVRRRSCGIASRSLLITRISVVHVLSSSVARRHVTTRVSPINMTKIY